MEQPRQHTAILTGYAHDVLFGQPRACTGRVISAVATGDGDVKENGCELYQEIAVPVAHKIIHVPRDRQLYC